MKVHDLKPDEGARKPAKRVGRGIGGKGGKTAGRGHKGQHARNTVKPGFEGGQTPLTRRIPKGKGFKNPFRVEYQGINLDTIAGLDFVAGSTVDPDALRQRGLVHKHGFVKILGRGELSGRAARQGARVLEDRRGGDHAGRGHGREAAAALQGPPGGQGQRPAVPLTAASDVNR